MNELVLVTFSMFETIACLCTALWLDTKNGPMEHVSYHYLTRIVLCRRMLWKLLSKAFRPVTWAGTSWCPEDNTDGLAGINNPCLWTSEDMRYCLVHLPTICITTKHVERWIVALIDDSLSNGMSGDGEVWCQTEFISLKRRWPLGQPAAAWSVLMISDMCSIDEKLVAGTCYCSKNRPELLLKMVEII